MTLGTRVEPVLLVVDAEPRDGEPIAPDTLLAGLTLRARIVKAGARAGFARIVDVDHGDGEAAARLAGPARLVVVPASVVPQPDWLRALLAMDLAPDTLYTDDSGAAVIETAEPARVAAALARRRHVADIVTRAPQALDGTRGRFVLRRRADLPAAERWLLRSLIKPSEGLMSRHFERLVSLALTRRLARTRLTPNAMTIISLVIGLGAAPFFLSSSPLLQLAGALLFLVHSILDGCDGELARLKFMESRGGAILDFWGDNAVHVAIFACLAVGASLTGAIPWPLPAGALAIASSVTVAALLSGRFLDAGAAGSAGSFTDRLVGALSHRDFIYVIVVLAAFGKAAWFLPAAAVGTPLFLALLLLARRRRGDAGA